MGLFSQMKAAAGVGASEVQIAVEKGRYHWADTLRGKIILSGGEIEQVASEVTVNITETWLESRRTHDGKTRQERMHRTYSERLVASQLAIAVGVSHEFEFELQVPNEGALAHDWYVAARISVPKAADRHGRADFQLLASRAVMGLVNAVCHVVPCELKSLSNRSTQVTVDLKPAANHSKDLDGLMLIVHAGGDPIVGAFEINPQEKSFKDRIKALAQQDRVKHQISFPAAPLAAAAEDATKVPPEIVEQFKGFIAPHLS